MDVFQEKFLDFETKYWYAIDLAYNKNHTTFVLNNFSLEFTRNLKVISGVQVQSESFCIIDEVT